jgi:hypothetical protein
MVRNTGSTVQNTALNSESWYTGATCVTRLGGQRSMKNWIRQATLETHMA